METKYNSAIAGFHMLHLLSNVDSEFSAEEGIVIVNYINDTFLLPVNFDKQIEVLSALKTEDYFPHFCKCMNDFYMDSTPKERAHFIDFAMQLVKADLKITKEENIFINELLSNWDPIASN